MSSTYPPGKIATPPPAVYPDQDQVSLLRFDEARSRRVRRFAVLAAVLSSALLGVLAARPEPVAAQQSGGWANWDPITGTSSDYATTMHLPARGFPAATVSTDSRADVQLAAGTSTYLGGAGSRVPTDVGTEFGSSRGHRYLTLRPKADNPDVPSTTTYTFDEPTPSTGWAFVLGDIDADQVRVEGKDADGTPLTPAQIDGWFQGAFNYAGAADLPTWRSPDLIGHDAARDTNGASGWFEPDVALSSLTFVYAERSGFPIYQTWFASLARTISGRVDDVSVAGASCPPEQARVVLVGPYGDELATTTPEPDGSYSFGEYATQGGYTVRIDRPGECADVGPAARTVSTSTSDATANFEIRKVRVQLVSGTVTTTRGTPVPDVRITLVPPDGGAPKQTTTDSEGNYLFDDNAEVPGYTVTMTVPADYAAAGPTSRAVTIPVGTPVTGQDFALRERPSVSGTITGGGGPLGAVTVTLTPDGGGAPITTSTQGDGTYTFVDVPAGRYSIAVTPPAGFRPAAAHQRVAVADADVTGEDFALTRPGTLSGRVSDARTGAAVAGVIVTVRSVGLLRTLTTDAAGEYYLDDLDPGRYEIVLTVPRGTVAAGMTTRVVTISASGEDRGGQDFRVRRAPSATTSAPPRSGSPSMPAGVTAATAQLAATGFSAKSPLLWAGGLVVAGLVLTGVGRRKPPRPR